MPCRTVITKPGAEEDTDLPEVDFFPFVVVSGCPQDHQLHLVVELLDLGSQVKFLGVLDSEIVQVELLPDLAELGRCSG